MPNIDQLEEPARLHLTVQAIIAWISPSQRPGDTNAAATVDLRQKQQHCRRGNSCRVLEVEQHPPSMRDNFAAKSLDQLKRCRSIDSEVEPFWYGNDDPIGRGIVSSAVRQRQSRSTLPMSLLVSRSSRQSALPTPYADALAKQLPASSYFSQDYVEQRVELRSFSAVMRRTTFCST
jgi:hypothetical protein